VENAGVEISGVNDGAIGAEHASVGAYNSIYALVTRPWLTITRTSAVAEGSRDVLVI